MHNVLLGTVQNLLTIDLCYIIYSPEGANVERQPMQRQQERNFNAKMASACVTPVSCSDMIAIHL
jgi:hypothetical protein